MRIIQVNKFYYLRGGAEKYLLTINKALEDAGHEVAVFSMNHPKNLASPYNKYFVSRVSFSESGFINMIHASLRIFWSFEAKRKFEKLVIDFKPDIIHLHNIYHHISPSILRVSKKYKIPVVIHLHDYKLICPNYQLFTQGKYCEACRSQKFYNCVRLKCFKNSRLKSLLVYLEMTLHHKILKIYENNLDLLIAPSQFIKDVFIKFGWPENKIKLLYNFCEKTDLQAAISSPENYLLYFGRLGPEKGIDILIKSLQNTQEKLKIAGAGPELEYLHKLSSNLGLNSQVEFLGFKSGSELNNLISSAKAIVIPSIWPENMPFSLLESMARGKVVLASDVGGLSELVKNEVNGFILIPQSSESIRNAYLELDQINLTEYGQRAREEVQPLELQIHLQKLVEIYQSLIVLKH